VVANPLPRDRRRDEMHTLSAFYPLRNHLIEFLVHRSVEERTSPAGQTDRWPPRVALDPASGRFEPL